MTTRRETQILKTEILDACARGLNELKDSMRGANLRIKRISGSGTDARMVVVDADTRYTRYFAVSVKEVM